MGSISLSPFNTVHPSPNISSFLVMDEVVIQKLTEEFMAATSQSKTVIS
jgi:hypothetical protein